MTKHRYQLGEIVRLKPGMHLVNYPTPHYKILRQLPASDVLGRVFLYELQHADDGHVRIVAESDIEAALEALAASADEAMKAGRKKAYLDRAEQLRTIASSVDDPAHSAMLEQAAEEYESMAGRED